MGRELAHIPPNQNVVENSYSLAEIVNIGCEIVNIGCEFNPH